MKPAIRKQNGTTCIDVVVNLNFGLCGRPSTQVVEECVKYPSKRSMFLVDSSGKEYDCMRIWEVMSTTASKGEQFTIKVEGEDLTAEQQALRLYSALTSEDSYNLNFNRFDDEFTFDWILGLFNTQRDRMGTEPQKVSEDWLSVHTYQIWRTLVEFKPKLVELLDKESNREKCSRRIAAEKLAQFLPELCEKELLPIEDVEYDFVKAYLESNCAKTDRGSRTEKEVLRKLLDLQRQSMSYERLKQILEAGRAENLDEMVECASIDINNYLLLSRLGRGGTKTAYVAKKGEDDVVVYVYAVNARIKQFMKNKGIGNLRSLIKRDARVSPFRVSHPNICYFDMNIDAKSGVEFGVSELCDGDLVGLFKKDFVNEEKTGFVKQILEGLAYAHRLGIVHSDVKPDNIFYKTSGDGIILKLADFGLSQTLEQINDREDSFMSIGHIDIRAPELHSPSGQRGLQADVWSFGCLLYWMWKKQYPFTVEGVRRPNTPGEERKNYESFAYSLKISEEHKRNLLENLKGSMPDSLIDITAKCWSTDPNKRYKDASAIWDLARKLGL